VVVSLKHFQPSELVAGKVKITNELLALPTNIRLGWKGYPETDLSAYLLPSLVTKKKVS